MFEVRAHHGKKRLYITLKGRLSGDELTAFVDRALQESRRLGHGFDTVTIVDGLEPLGDGELEHIQRLLKEQLALGEGRVVRVVGKSTAAAVQFERVGKKLGRSAHLAFSVAEAERLLDGRVE